MSSYTKKPTSYLTENIINYSNLSISLNVSSTTNFRFWNGKSSDQSDSYHSLNFSTYLNFTYTPKKTSNDEPVGESIRATFSYTNMYFLKDRFNYVAELITEKEDEIFLDISNDENEVDIQISDNYKRFNVSIDSFGKTIGLGFDVKEIERKGTIEPVVSIKFQTKKFSVNIPLAEFLSINNEIQKFDLLTASQNLVMLYKSDKIESMLMRLNTKTRRVIEEAVEGE